MYIIMNMKTKMKVLSVSVWGEHWWNMPNWGFIPHLFYMSIHKTPDKHITIIVCFMGTECALDDETTWWACLHLAQQGFHWPSVPFSEPLVTAPLICSPRIVAGFRLGSSSSSPHAIPRHSFVKDEGRLIPVLFCNAQEHLISCRQNPWPGKGATRPVLLGRGWDCSNQWQGRSLISVWAAMAPCPIRSKLHTSLSD